jgi:hypothetical protein
VKRHEFVVTLVVTLIVFTGCGGTSRSSLDSLSPPNSDAVTSGTGQEISVPEAAQNFVNAVTPAECQAYHYTVLADRSWGSIDNPQHHSYISLEELTESMRRISQSRQSSITQLTSLNWPQSIRKSIERFTSYWESLANAEQVAGNVKVLGSSEEDRDNLGTWRGAIRKRVELIKSPEALLSKSIRDKLSLPAFSPSECS